VKYESKKPIENIDKIDNSKLTKKIDYLLQNNIEAYLQEFK
jgi:hypothetical protein